MARGERQARAGRRGVPRQYAALGWALACVCSTLLLSEAQFIPSNMGGAVQSTLQKLCNDQQLKILLKSVCEPDGEMAQAINTATDADLKEFEPYTQKYASSGKPKTEGEACLIDPAEINLVDTRHLETEGDGPRAAANEFVVSYLDRLSNDISQYFTKQSKKEEDFANSREDEKATYTVIGTSQGAFCQRGLQCEVNPEPTSDTDATTSAAAAGDGGGGDSLSARSNLTIPGTCTQCRPGTYCPFGTVNDNTGILLFSSAATNLCPEGFFCPDPATVKNCPVGLFCPAGSVKPLDCNGLSFNASRKGADFTAILDGNYCPINSMEPWSLCPAKYFCPNASTIYECPTGFYCPVMTTEPMPCPMLSACPKGSASPQVSWMALIGFILILVAVYGPSCYALWSHKRASEKVDSNKLSFNQTLVSVICRIVLPEYKPARIYETLKLETLVFAADPIQLDISQLTISHRKRVILSGVDMSFPPWSLNAIFGPSGAGKTTLIKSALGKLAYNLKIRGEVSYTKCKTNKKVVIYSTRLQSRVCNVMEVFGTSRARKKIIKLKVGYVPQDNVIYQNLTVEENILFSVKMRNRSGGDKYKITEQILHLLGLTSIRNSVVGNPDRGGISGGEGRRVSIGLELAGSPLCLILDEPTTGLDAVSADKVLKCLNYLAKSGMTIIASIHQPKSSIFHLFDQVHILMKGGYVVYTGPKDRTMPYFASIGFKIPALENPADFIVDVISGLVNREKCPDFTTEDLPDLWIQNKDGDSLTCHRSSIAGQGSSKESFRSENTDSFFSSDSSEFEDFDDMIPELQDVLTSHPELNEMENAYDLEYYDLPTLLDQICTACCHLEHFINIRECQRYMCSSFDTYSIQAAEEEEPAGHPCSGIDEADPALSAMKGQYATAKNSKRTRNEAATRMKSKLSDSSRKLSSNLRSMSRRKSIGGSLIASGTICRHLLTKDMLGWVRSLGLKSVDIFTTAVFAVVLGFNQGAGLKTVQDILYMSMLSNLYVGMLSVVWAVNFQLDRMKSAQREAGGSVPTSLIFTSAMCSDLIDSFLRPTVFSVLYYFISLPRMSFGNFYTVILGVALSCSGLGYLIAVVFPENLAVIGGIIIAFVFGGILNGFAPFLTDLPSPWLAFPSYARWGIEVSK